MEWPNHTGPWREWREAMKGARMHHGWLLAGKSGLGKHDFALAAARELVAEEGIPQPAGDHPDIITVTFGPKDKKAIAAMDAGKEYELSNVIKIEQIRAMERRLHTRPTLGSRRVIIVEPADEMNVNASNALLKSLEEPPQGTFFMLVSHRPSRLLPTIRSRCRMLRFPALNAMQLEQMLEQATDDSTPVARQAALKAAQGSFGTALGFLEHDLAPIAELFRTILSDGDAEFSARGALARKIGARADRARIQAVLELAQSHVADLAKTAQSVSHRARLIDAHGKLVALAGQAPTYNFDTGLLTLEIGTLLVEASAASEPAHG